MKDIDDVKSELEKEVRRPPAQAFHWLKKKREIRLGKRRGLNQGGKTSSQLWREKASDVNVIFEIIVANNAKLVQILANVR